MKAKVIELLNNHIELYRGKEISFIAEAIDALYKEDLEKRVAFEVACNPDLLEAETNYKLYEGEIKQLKEIIQAQDEYTLNLLSFHQDTDYFKTIYLLQSKVTELKKGAGL